MKRQSSSQSPWKQPASSDYESQFRKVIEQFQSSLSLLAENRLTGEGSSCADEVDPDLEGKLENMIETEVGLRVSCSDLYARTARQKERSIFLLSRKTDIERQTEESRRVIDSQTAERSKQSNFLHTQQLDAESERFRRSLAVKALMVNRALESVEHRIVVTRGICDIHDHEWAEASISISGLDRKNVLFEALTSGFRRTQQFQEEASRTANRLSRYMESIPPVVSGGNISTTPFQSPSHSTPLSGKRLSSRTRRNRLTPVPLSTPVAKSPGRPLSRVVPSRKAEKWAKIEQTMRKTRVDAFPNKKLQKLSRIGSASAIALPAHQGRPAKATGPSLLLSSLREGPKRNERSTMQPEPLVFSSPVSKARPDWSLGSESDQAKVQAVSLSFPEQLKKVDTSEAARVALSGFGTTPEKADRAIEMRKKYGETSGEDTKMSASRMGSSRTSSRSKPQTDSEKGSSSSTSFPPLSAKAPTPFSLSTKTTGKGTDAKGFSSYPPSATEAAAQSGPTSSSGRPETPPLSSKQVSSENQRSKGGVSLQPKTPLHPLSSSAKNTDEQKSENVAPSAFGNLQGLSDSLFSEKSEESPPGIQSGTSLFGAGSATDSDSPDYHSILADFYKVHNPSKMGEVDQTLEKYKVSFCHGGQLIVCHEEPIAEEADSILYVVFRREER